VARPGATFSKLLTEDLTKISHLRKILAKDARSQNTLGKDPGKILGNVLLRNAKEAVQHLDWKRS